MIAPPRFRAPNTTTRHGWLVVGWATACVDEDPAVRERDDRGAFGDDFTAEDIGVEVSRASDVLRHDKVGE